MDPITIIAAIGPVLGQMAHALIGKYIAPDEFKPTSIDEYERMRKCDVDQFKAMNEAGGSNQSYLWVEAIVRLMRPAVAMIAMGAWVYSHVSGAPSDAVDNFAGAVGFWLFMDRTLFYARRPKAGS